MLDIISNRLDIISSFGWQSKSGANSFLPLNTALRYLKPELFISFLSWSYISSNQDSSTVISTCLKQLEIILHSLFLPSPHYEKGFGARFLTWAVQLKFSSSSKPSASWNTLSVKTFCFNDCFFSLSVLQVFWVPYASLSCYIIVFNRSKLFFVVAFFFSARFVTLVQ